MKLRSHGTKSSLLVTNCPFNVQLPCRFSVPQRQRLGKAPPPVSIVSSFGGTTPGGVGDILTRWNSGYLRRGDQDSAAAYEQDTEPRAQRQMLAKERNAEKRDQDHAKLVDRGHTCSVTEL
jgi:hypothetical protein